MPSKRFRPRARCGSAQRLQLSRAGRKPLAVLAAVLTIAGSAGAGIAQQAQEPATDDVLAFCTAWQLTAKAIEVAGEIQAVAASRLERAQKLVEECTADSKCAREERVNREQELRETRYQQAQASKLAATMEQRRTELRRHIEQARGAGAAEKCGGG